MMNSAYKCCSIVVLASALSGCMANPVPEDVTDNTVTIVKKIRCEARDAVRSKLIETLVAKGGKAEKDFAAELAADPSLILTINDAPIGKTLQDYYRPYAGGAIGYDFDFDITVHSDNSLGINLLNVFSNGKRTIDIGGGLERQNQGVRSFQIVDTFDDLTKLYKKDKYGKDFCSNLKPGNSLYPITGKIGLAEVVSTFVDLNDMAGIEAEKEGDKATTYSHSIEFQTIVSGRVNPKIELSPIKHGFSLADASMTNDYKRTDKHKVIIALQLKPQQTPVASGAKPKQVRPATGVVNTLNEKKVIEKLTPLNNFIDQLR